MLKKLNDKLHLSFQLYNGPEGSDTRVFCQLKDQAGVNIGSEIEIPHVVNGFYTENTELMPANEVVFACFRFTEADGVTQSCEHTFYTQRYDRDFAAEQVESLRPVPGAIIGEVQTANITAEIIDLENEEVIGEIQEVQEIGPLPSRAVRFAKGNFSSANNDLRTFISSDPIFEFNESFAFIIILKPEGIGTSFDTVFGHWGFNTANQVYNLNYNPSNGNFTFQIRDTAGSVRQVQIGSNNNNEEHLVYCHYNHLTNEIALSVNGSNFTIVSTVNAIDISRYNEKFRIGGRSDSTDGNGFEGVIDDLYIFSAPQSLSLVQNIYNSGSFLNPANLTAGEKQDLIMLYEFNETKDLQTDSIGGVVLESGGGGDYREFIDGFYLIHEPGKGPNITANTSSEDIVETINDNEITGEIQ